MANEITAEELARKMAELDGRGFEDATFIVDATRYVNTIRAHTALMAERAKPVFGDLTVGLGKMQAERAKGAPERVRCWIGAFFNGTSEVTIRENLADAWRAHGHTITEGYFTAKGSTDD